MSALSPVRIFLALIGLGFIALGVVLIVNNPNIIPVGIWLIVIGTLTIIGALFERLRYKPIEFSNPQGSVATGERFIDHETNQLVDVYFDPATGERSYVAAKDDL